MKFQTAEKRLQDKINDPKNNQWRRHFCLVPVRIKGYIYWLCYVERKRDGWYDWRFVWEYRTIEKDSK